VYVGPPLAGLAIATIQELTVELEKLRWAHENVKTRLVENIDVMANQQKALRELLGLWDRFGQGPWIDSRPELVAKIAEIRTLASG
jgi:hypothetical protein